MDSKNYQTLFESFRQKVEEILSKEQRSRFLIEKDLDELFVHNKKNINHFTKDLTDQNMQSSLLIEYQVSRWKTLLEQVQTQVKHVEEWFKQYTPFVKVLDEFTQVKQKSIAFKIDSFYEFTNRFREYFVQIFKKKSELNYLNIISTWECYIALNKEFNSFKSLKEPEVILWDHYFAIKYNKCNDDFYFYDVCKRKIMFQNIQLKSIQERLKTTSSNLLENSVFSFIRLSDQFDFQFESRIFQDKQQKEAIYDNQEEIDFENQKLEFSQEKENNTKIIFSEEEKAHLETLINKFQSNPELRDLTIDEAFRLPTNMGLNMIGAFKLKRLTINQIHKESQSITNLVREGASLQELSLQGVGINSYLETIQFSKALNKLTITKCDHQDRDEKSYIDQTTIEIICTFKHLTKLNLTDNLVSENQIKQLFGSLLELKRLSLPKGKVFFREQSSVADMQLKQSTQEMFPSQSSSTSVQIASESINQEVQMSEECNYFRIEPQDQPSGCDIDSNEATSQQINFQSVEDWFNPQLAKIYIVESDFYHEQHQISNDESQQANFYSIEQLSGSSAKKMRKCDSDDNVTLFCGESGSDFISIHCQSEDEQSQIQNHLIQSEDEFEYNLTHTVELSEGIAVNVGEVINIEKTVWNWGLLPWPETTCLVQDLPDADDYDGLLVGAIGSKQYAFLNFKVTVPPICGKVKFVFRFKEKLGGEVFGEKIIIKLYVRDSSQQNTEQANNVEDQDNQSYRYHQPNDVVFYDNQRETMIKEKD